jgi:uncharacterized repeat protein (TIGR04138 family)
MQKSDFSDCLDALVAADPRYEKEAYLFVKEALDFTLKQRQPGAQKTPRRNSGAGKTAAKEEPERHVSGQQLVAGARDLALAEWGPMAITVLSHWGIQSTADIGAIVFNLIDARIFGKNEQDSRADFQDVFSFHEAFVLPYQPANGTAVPAGGMSPPPRAPRAPSASPFSES